MTLQNSGLKPGVMQISKLGSINIAIIVVKMFIKIIR